jgi:hypothetical protein
MFSSNQDLQIYQQNQNESHHSFWSLSHRLGANNIVSYKDENVFGNSTGCASRYYKAKAITKLKTRPQICSPFQIYELPTHALALYSAHHRPLTIAHLWNSLSASQ